ncbi:ABC-F family ATP-binding cassette domain-containing protein [Vibrio ostreicida]|uniref:ATP-binding cassette domain-containing protein n=1 Tax=Vibrio ostreicida TaxID=526588 RepID=A0ABT8BZ86_9VIBR|nr:ATP-binding cassette domain-containing protein [Vibrio ostreicida]MDN3611393.1 ATP-binding cassette domain-containing protein [Vibrio ostreicida]NPD09324.1 ABC-F family ATP-binding cassette domain-containing protein [Vibrio ostreicida]
MQFSFHHVSLTVDTQPLIDDFSAAIQNGDRIGIIGRNGSGKSCLLRLMLGTLSPAKGKVMRGKDLRMGYVSQTDTGHASLSGGQRFQQKLTQALSIGPDMLLLDEPTNHLDRANLKSLMRLLTHFSGTLVMVSHDEALLRACTDRIWAIDHGRIDTFTGHYDHYLVARQQRRAKLTKDIAALERAKQQTHQKRMKAQNRAASSKAQGQKSIDNRKWATIVSKTKTDRGNTSTNKKQAELRQTQAALAGQLHELHVPDAIRPSFALSLYSPSKGVLISAHNGRLGYEDKGDVLSEINLTINQGDRILISGNNGSGKSTLIRAFLGDDGVNIAGEWTRVERQHITYLDQHYANLDPMLSVFDSLKTLKPQWTQQEIRTKLNAFLFRSNDEVQRRTECLSGGEKARLSLCLIAVVASKMLILDEVSNNLDLETKAHVKAIIRHYPGTLVLISHEPAFIQGVGCDRHWRIEQGKVVDVALPSPEEPLHHIG